MGSLFGRKKIRKPEQVAPQSPTFEQLSYGAAFSLLPYYLFGDEVGGNRNLLLQAPKVAGIKLLVGVSMMADFEPDELLMNRFSETKGHSGQLADGVQYRIVEYPQPAPIDIGDLEELKNSTPERLIEKLASVVPAPYFSILLLSDELEILEYLVLSQSPDGNTSLRQVDTEVNANLGLGCEPRLDALLAFLAERLK